MEQESVNVRELVDKALVPLDSRANVVTSVSERGPLKRVRADPLLLRQAIENVVNNAVQAMSNGGTLTVELEAVIPSSRTTAGGSLAAPGVQLIFRDTGEGMDTVVRSRALDPFFTTRPSGTGLGLAIVARVVDAHGGYLRILSEPDVGTEVRIFLPEEPDTSRPGSRSRILPPVIEPFSPLAKVAGRGR
jgi:signal transduction histidine kinase